CSLTAGPDRTGPRNPLAKLEKMLSLEGRLRLEASQLRLELGDVAELAVHGRETDVGHPIQLLQPPQGELADALRRGCVPLRAQAGDDPVDQGLELLALDRPLDCRPLEAGEELEPIEGLSGAVTLADVERPLLIALVGGEAALAGATPTAPANRIAGFRQARVHYLGIVLSAEGAAHRSDPIVPLDVLPAPALLHNI